MLNPKLFIVSANEVPQYPKLVGYNNGAVVELADLSKKIKNLQSENPSCQKLSQWLPSQRSSNSH